MKREVERSEQSDFNPGGSQELRNRAEALVKEKKRLSPEDLKVMSLEEMRQVLHELDVYQIELEMQNEELLGAHKEVDRLRARYFDLYDLAPVGYCSVSEDGQILEANLTLAILLGVTRQALESPKIPSFIFNDDQDIYYLHNKRLFESGERQEYQLRMVKEDKMVFWAQLAATVIENEEGASTGRIVISDITERKNAQDLIRASEEKYRLITENVSDVISVYNVTKCKYTYISPSIFQLRGLTVEEAMNEGMEKKFTAESLANLKEDMKMRIQEFIKDPEKPQSYIDETEEYAKDGEIVWVERATKCRFNAEGEIEIVGISRNITERISAFADAYEAMIADEICGNH